MRKQIIIFALALAVFMTAMPAFAEIEVKVNGRQRIRFQESNNIGDGTNVNFGELAGGTYNGNDNKRVIDQRTNFQIRFESGTTALVNRFEIGDPKWGDPNGSTGPGSGGNVGADAVSIKVKNIFLSFKIPGIPTTANLGIQQVALLDSWVIFDDFSAVTFDTKLPPFRFGLGYIAAQSGAETTNNVVQNSMLAYSSDAWNVNDFFASMDYTHNNWSGSLVLFYQQGNETTISVDPNTLGNPYRGAYYPSHSAFIQGNGVNVTENNLFDLGLNLTYKDIKYKAYVNFVKNLGWVEYENGGISNYDGYMVDAGVSYYRGAFEYNLGGFYTSGPEINVNSPDFATRFTGLSSKNVDWFTYPQSTMKYFSELIGGGILNDDYSAYRGYSKDVTANQVGWINGMGSVYWRGTQYPTNLWTVTFGTSWQVFEKTKISSSYWYFGTAEPVPTRFNVDTGAFKMSSSIGHELDLLIDQNITERLAITLVGAYLVSDAAFCPLPVQGFQNLPTNAHGWTTPLDDDSYEMGARLLWVF